MNNWPQIIMYQDNLPRTNIFLPFLQWRLMIKYIYLNSFEININLILEICCILQSCVSRKCQTLWTKIQSKPLLTKHFEKKLKTNRNIQNLCLFFKLNKFKPVVRQKKKSMSIRSTKMSRSGKPPLGAGSNFAMVELLATAFTMARSLLNSFICCLILSMFLSYQTLVFTTIAKVLRPVSTSSIYRRGFTS